MMIVYRVIYHDKKRYDIEASVNDEVVESAELINIDELEVTKLALLCNQEQLSPIHLKDVVEDVSYRINNKK
ncbi:MAG: hypothetical protein IJB57_00845 [Clostridia bacterium]|nr:hypothetical protein [Clostridia bacterium]